MKNKLLLLFAVASLAWHFVLQPVQPSKPAPVCPVPKQPDVKPAPPPVPSPPPAPQPRP